MQTSWKIIEMRREESTGIVRYARWELSATSDGNTQNISGESHWYTNEPSIPYEELTEQIVLNWVWNFLGADKQKIETYVIRHLEDMLKPVTITALPWSAT